MNPASLKTLVDQHAAGPSASSLGMAPPSDPDMDDDADLDEDPVEAGATGAERGNELIASWGEFGETIKEEAKELVELAVDAGPGLLLKEPDEDAIKAVEKAVDKMPDELSMGLSKYVSQLSPEDCEGLAMALAAIAGEDTDENLLCAFISAAGKYAGEEIEVDEDFNKSEEDEESDDEGDDAEGGDEAAAAAPPAPPAEGA